MTLLRGDDRRRLVPQALCAVIRTLIADEPSDPSAARVELRSLLFRIQRLYNLDTKVNEVELAQQLAEEDGHAVEE